MSVPSGLWRVRTWSWKEWSAASTFTVLFALAYARLAWTEGIGIRTTCYGDACLIEENPFLWFPDVVALLGPPGEAWIFVVYAYWVFLGMLTSWLAITVFRLAQRRLRGPTLDAVP